MTCWASQAADDHAAQIDEAEKWATYVETFASDAADELIANPVLLSELLDMSGTPEVYALLSLTLTKFGDERSMALYDFKQAVHALAMRDDWAAARAQELANEAVKQAEEDGVTA